jgi:hypothetical protein
MSAINAHGKIILIMIVWIKAAHSDENDNIKQKRIAYGGIFVTKFINYFENRSYGDNVQEILFREFCLKDGYHDKLLHYGKKRKIIDCAVVADYPTALKLDVQEYGKYIASLYLDRSKSFGDLKIKDFDSDNFSKDLEFFFKEIGLL